MKLGRLLLISIVVCLSAIPIISRADEPTQPALTAWKLLDMQRADQPNVIVADGKNGQALRLKEDWQAARIEYVYKWWGLAEPSFDYQIVSKVGKGYQRGSAIIDSKLVTNFLHSLTNLHRSQFILEGQDHTDDYPSWLIEITGEDGQRVQLYSASTGNAGSAPWNIIYNGRMYAQYDGSLAEPMTALFTGKTDSPAAAFFPGGAKNGVGFSTSGWLPQLSNGFVGLLPVADGFHYDIDLTTHTMHGTVEGRSSIGGFGHMVIGAITKLAKIEVQNGDGKKLDCTFKRLESQDPSAAAWEFTCKGADARLDLAYDYPISITFGTDKDETITAEGRLQGVGHDADAVLAVPLPDELQTALADNADAHDILSDHVPIHAYYVASIDPTNMKRGTLFGQIILLGQAGAVRYTVGTPFVIQDGKLTVWSLTRRTLEGMVTEITELALTKRVVKDVPDATLNMWYAESYALPTVSTLINAYPDAYSLSVQECGNLPSGLVPGVQPMQAFSFEGRWDFWLPDFVLLDGVPVIYDLSLYPNLTTSPVHRDLAAVLMPKALYTDTLETFASVRATNVSYRRALPELQLAVSKDITEVTRQHLRELVDGLPFTMDYKLDSTWVAMRETLKVTDNGELALFGCDIK